jgi:Prolyl oligopeptidase family
MCQQSAQAIYRSTISTKAIFSDCTTQSNTDARHIFVSPDVAKLMRDSSFFPWIPKVPSDTGGPLKIWRKTESKTIYWHYHFSVYGKFEQKKRDQLKAIGELDAVRAEESANGITNVSEFGSYKNPAEFPALLEISTYHQTRDDVDYPAALLVHGMNDRRVDAWQSGKAAARLQAATHSGKPVQKRIDEQAAHGIGSTIGQAISKQADV